MDAPTPLPEYVAVRVKGLACQSLTFNLGA